MQFLKGRMPQTPITYNNFDIKRNISHKIVSFKFINKIKINKKIYYINRSWLKLLVKII